MASSESSWRGSAADLGRLWLLAALAITILSLAACGGGGAEETPGPGPTLAPAPGPAPAPPPPPQAPPPVPTPLPGASSFDLIDAALAAGTINAETALSFRVFATFRDPRLPTQYAGDRSLIEHNEALTDVLRVWSTLSAGTQDALGPFLAPPAYLGSRAATAMQRTQGAVVRAASAADAFMCQRPEFNPSWASTPISGGNVKVWYDTRNPLDQAYAVHVAEVVNNEVWPKLFGTLAMKAPLKDKTSISAYEGCNGDDDRFDIYLASLNTRAELAHTQPIVPGRRAMPVYMVLHNNLVDADLRYTLAHEFMHASQWAYNVQSGSFAASHKWLREATATWAGDYVFPPDNFEHRKAPHYFKTPELSLERTQGLPEDRMYGAYLFFQFVANKAGGAPRIPLMWAQTEVLADQVDAVDAALPGGFVETWHKFAKHHWNQDPVHLDSYNAWDAPAAAGTSVGTPTVFGGAPIQVDLGGRMNREYDMDTNVPHLAIHYHHFKFVDGAGSIPNDLRSVTIEHEPAVGGGRVRVQAIFRRIDGAWQVEDWSPVSGSWLGIRRSCFDVRAERYAELVLVVSNGDPHVDAVNVADQKLRLGVNNIGCWRWQGRATFSASMAQSGVSANVDADATDVIFERIPPFQFTDAIQRYRVISGKFAASLRAIDAVGCRQSARISNVSVLDNGGQGEMYINNYGLSGWLPGLTEGMGLGGYRGRAFTAVNAPGVVECQGRSDPFTYPGLGADWFKAGDIELPGHPMSVRSSGAMSENFVLPDTPDAQIGYTWTFTPLREP